MGSKIATYLHSQSLIGANKTDFAGIHSAQCPNIQIYPPAFAMQRCRRIAVGVYLIFTCDYVYLILCPDFCINICCIGIDIQFAGRCIFVLTACLVQYRHDTCTSYIYLSFFYSKAIKSSVRVDIRLACSKDCSINVDKACSIDINAVGVGYDKVRLAACYFHKTVKACSTSASYLLQNGLGCITCQVSIDIYLACKNCIYRRLSSIIIEYKAFLAYIKGTCLVMGQACSIRYCNIHHRGRCLGSSKGSIAWHYCLHL